MANNSVAGGGGSVTAYGADPSGTLDEAPLATIAGSNTAFYDWDPLGIAVDASGKIYVASSNGFGEGGNVTVYAANPSGTLNEAPLATINAPGPQGIALDASGNIYVANVFGGDVEYTSSITVYAANPTGTLNEAPLATISGSNTGLNDNAIQAIALDKSGKIYVAGVNGGIAVYAANPSGTLNEGPLATITGSNTELDGQVFGIAVDPSGEIYVANFWGASITVYAANPSGTVNEAPLATITGSNTGLGNPRGVAVDASGKIYVPNGNSISVYAASPSGTLNEAPLATISGGNTGLGDPTGIAIH